MDQSFILSMLEMVVNGVSTRKVKSVVEELCGESVSKSFVSSLTAKLDPIVKEWANRPLNTERYPYIFVDAMYIKVREHHKVVSKAVYIAAAIREDHRREVLGFKVDHAESLEAWQSFFQDLKGRGLQSPRLIISDAHAGLRKAIEREFIGTSWQRCTVHFKRNLFDKLPKKDMEAVKEDLKRIFYAVTVEDARKYKDEFFEKYAENEKLAKVCETLEDGFEDAIQYMNELPKYHRFIHSTNWVERLNQEVRRRERVIRIFPNTQSAFRLIGAVLMDIDEELEQKKIIIKTE
jgi:putative transposase